jgi:hypothetical protein
MSKYQIQWIHNGSWRIEEEGSGDFDSLEEAEFAASSENYDSVSESLRIVKIGPKSIRVFKTR